MTPEEQAREALAHWTWNGTDDLVEQIAKACRAAFNAGLEEAEEIVWNIEPGDLIERDAKEAIVEAIRARLSPQEKEGK